MPALQATPHASSTPVQASQRCRALALRMARVLGCLGLISQLLACNPLRGVGGVGEVSVAVRSVTATPAEVQFDPQETAGAGRDVTLAVAISAVLDQAVDAKRLTVSLRQPVPAGLQVEAPAGPAANTPGGLTFGTGDTVETVPVRIAVAGSTPIGQQLSAGRHNVTLSVTACAVGFEDANDFLPNDQASACSTREAVITVIVTGAPVPGLPTGLAATVLPRQAELTWAADPAPERYRLERAPASGVFTTIATLQAPVTQHLDTGLDPNTAYTYRLTPINAAGSGPAATLAVLTPADGPVGNGVLGVALSGTGSGRVTSNPAGIDCPGDCAETLPLGRSVTLVATPAIGSVFERWSGDADCTDGVVTITTELACVAVFSPAPAGNRGWQPLGSEVVASGGLAPVVAADRLGPVYVALRRQSGAFGELQVHRYNGSAWPALGGGAVNQPSGLGATSHGLVVDRDGRPVVAWSEPGGVKVARWDGTRWEFIANDLRVDTTAVPQQVQLAVRDLAVVATWLESVAGTLHLRAKTYNGVAWFGGDGLVLPNLSGYRLALDANGLPAVVATRAVGGQQQPLQAHRASAFQASSVSWQALGGDIPVATGSFFQHEQLGFGLAFTNDGAGAPVVLGTRDTRYAYVKNFNGVAWVPAGQAGVDADGVLADIVPASGETLRGVLALNSTNPTVLLHIAPVNTLLPHRVELRSLSGLGWVPWTDPLEVSRLSAVTSIVLDATAEPVLSTLEGFGVGGLGRVRVYRWVP